MTVWDGCLPEGNLLEARSGLSMTSFPLLTWTLMPPSAENKACSHSGRTHRMLGLLKSWFPAWLIKKRKYKEEARIDPLLLPASYLKRQMRFMFIIDCQVKLTSSLLEFRWLLFTSSHGLSLEFSRSLWPGLHFPALLSHSRQLIYIEKKQQLYLMKYELLSGVQENWWNGLILW